MISKNCVTFISRVKNNKTVQYEVRTYPHFLSAETKQFPDAPLKVSFKKV